MSISDSSFTNPDSLRARYINPRNVLLNLDEQASGETATTAGDGAALVISSSSNQSSPILQQLRQSQVKTLDPRNPDIDLPNEF